MQKCDIEKSWQTTYALKVTKEEFDTIKQNVITFNATPIQMNHTFYNWLKELQTDETLQYKVN